MTFSTVPYKTYQSINLAICLHCLHLLHQVPLIVLQSAAVSQPLLTLTESSFDDIESLAPPEQASLDVTSNDAPIQYSLSLPSFRIPIYIEPALYQELLHGLQQVPFSDVRNQLLVPYVAHRELYLMSVVNTFMHLLRTIHPLEGHYTCPYCSCVLVNHINKYHLEDNRRMYLCRRAGCNGGGYIVCYF